MYVPDDWIEIVKEARPNHPFNVVNMNALTIFNFFNRYGTAINFLHIYLWSAVCAINYLLRTALFRAYMHGMCQWWLA